MRYSPLTILDTPYACMESVHKSLMSERQLGLARLGLNPMTGQSHTEINPVVLRISDFTIPLGAYFLNKTAHFHWQQHLKDNEYTDERGLVHSIQENSDGTFYLIHPTEGKYSVEMGRDNFTVLTHMLDGTKKTFCKTSGCIISCAHQNKDKIIYDYNDAGLINKIIFPRGQVLHFERIGRELNLNYQSADPEKNQTLLQTIYFSDDACTQVESMSWPGYEVNDKAPENIWVDFNYDDARLVVKQSEGCEFAFNFDGQRVQTIKIGDEQYEVNDDGNKTTLKNSSLGEITFEHDEQCLKKIINNEQAHHFKHDNANRLTHYQLGGDALKEDAADLIQNYDSEFGIKENKKSAQGEVKTRVLSKENNTIILQHSKTIQNNTVYAYDVYEGRRLVASVSYTGCVRWFRHDKNARRIFETDRYYDFADSPDSLDVGALRNWFFRAACIETKVELDNKGHPIKETTGRLSATYQYNHTRALLEEISEKEHELRKLDSLGREREQQRFASDTQASLHQSTYEENKTTLEVNGVQTELTHNSADVVTESKTDLLIHRTTLDAAGLESHSVESANGVPGLQCKMLRANGLLHAKLHESGLLEVFDYEADTLLPTSTTAYDLSRGELNFNEAHLEDMNNLMSLIRLRAPLSKKYHFYDSKKRPIFEIDAEGYVSATEYDAQGNVFRQSRYDDKLPAEILLNSEAIENYYQNKPGRHHYTLYDADDRLQYQINVHGGATYYQRNGLNQIENEIAYAESVTQTPSRVMSMGELLAAIKTAENKSTEKNKDRRIQRFYNGEKKCCAVIDARGYLKLIEYDYANKSKTIKQCLKPLTEPERALSLKDIKLKFDSKDFQQSRYQYDDLGRVICESHLNGKVVEYSYFKDTNKPTSVCVYHNRDKENPNQKRTTLYKYDKQGRKERVFLPHVVAKHSDKGQRYRYNDFGDCSQIINEVGESIWQFYDASHRLRATITDHGVVTLFDYDAKHRDYQRKTVLNHRYAHQRDFEKILGLYDLIEVELNELRNKEKDSTWQRHFSPNGHLDKLIDPELRETEQHYNAHDECTQKIIQLESGLKARRIETHVFDLDKNQWRHKALEGGSKTEQTEKFDVFSDRIEVIDGNRNTWQFTHDAAGNVIEILQPDQSCIKQAFDVYSRLLKKSMPYSKEDLAKNNLTIDEIILAIKKEYDDAKGEIKITDLLSRVSTQVHNVFGELESEESASGLKTSQAHHLAEHKTVKKGHLGKKVTLTEEESRDDASRLIERKAPSGARQEFSNFEGRSATCVQDFKSGSENPYRKTSLKMNSLGIEVEKTTTAIEKNKSHTQTQQVDRAGHVEATMVDPDGLRLTTHSPKDALGRSSAQSYSGLTNQDLAKLEQTGELATHQFKLPEQFKAIYGYDVFHALSKQTKQSDGQSHVQQQEVDGCGNIIKTTDAEGDHTHYIYDSMHRLRFKVNPLGGVTEWQYQPGMKHPHIKRIHQTPIELEQSFDKDEHKSRQQAGLFYLESVFNHLEKPISRDDYHQIEYEYAQDHVLTASLDEGQLVQYHYDVHGETHTKISYQQIYADSLAQAIKSAASASASQMRVTHIIRDRLGRVRFEIDGEGYVKEYRYDKRFKTKKCTHIIEYSGRYPNHALLRKPSKHDVKQILKDNQAAFGLKSARMSQAFFDDRELKTHSIDNHGYVTQYEYDDFEKFEREVSYGEAYLKSKDEACVTLADLEMHIKSNLEANKKYSEIKYQRDNVLRVEVKTVNGEQTHYNYDCLSHLLSTTFKNQLTEDEYDDFARHVKQIIHNLPAALIHDKLDEKEKSESIDHLNQLELVVAGLLTVETELEPNKNNQVTTETKAAKIYQTQAEGKGDEFKTAKRKIKHHLNALGSIIANQHLQAELDDHAARPKINAKPVQTADVSAYTFRFAHNEVFCELAPDDYPVFKIRDRDGYLKYKLHGHGLLESFERDGFKDVVSCQKYGVEFDKGLIQDWLKRLKVAQSLAGCEQLKSYLQLHQDMKQACDAFVALKENANHPDNRKTDFTHDKRGLEIAVISPESMRHYIDASDGQKKSQPLREVKYKYIDAFSEKYASSSTLVSTRNDNQSTVHGQKHLHIKRAFAQPNAQLELSLDGYLTVTFFSHTHQPVRKLKLAHSFLNDQDFKDLCLNESTSFNSIETYYKEYASQLPEDKTRLTESDLLRSLDIDESIEYDNQDRIKTRIIQNQFYYLLEDNQPKLQCRDKITHFEYFDHPIHPGLTWRASYDEQLPERKHYELLDQEGHVLVVVSPEKKTALLEEDNQSTRSIHVHLNNVHGEAALWRHYEGVDFSKQARKQIKSAETSLLADESDEDYFGVNSDQEQSRAQAEQKEQERAILNLNLNDLSDLGSAFRQKLKAYDSRANLAAEQSATGYVERMSYDQCNRVLRAWSYLTGIDYHTGEKQEKPDLQEKRYRYQGDGKVQAIYTLAATTLTQTILSEVLNNRKELYAQLEPKDAVHSTQGTLQKMIAAYLVKLRENAKELGFDSQDEIGYEKQGFVYNVFSEVLHETIERMCYDASAKRVIFSDCEYNAKRYDNTGFAFLDFNHQNQLAIHVADLSGKAALSFSSLEKDLKRYSKNDIRQLIVDYEKQSELQKASVDGIQCVEKTLLPSGLPEEELGPHYQNQLIDETLLQQTMIDVDAYQIRWYDNLDASYLVEIRLKNKNDAQANAISKTVQSEFVGDKRYLRVDIEDLAPGDYELEILYTRKENPQDEHSESLNTKRIVHALSKKTHSIEQVGQDLLRVIHDHANPVIAIDCLLADGTSKTLYAKSDIKNKQSHFDLSSVHQRIEQVVVKTISALRPVAQNRMYTCPLNGYLFTSTNKHDGVATRVFYQNHQYFPKGARRVYAQIKYIEKNAGPHAPIKTMLFPNSGYDNEQIKQCQWKNDSIGSPNDFYNSLSIQMHSQNWQAVELAILAEDEQKPHDKKVLNRFTQTPNTTLSYDQNKISQFYPSDDWLYIDGCDADHILVSDQDNQILGMLETESWFGQTRRINLAQLKSKYALADLRLQMIRKGLLTSEESRTIAVTPEQQVSQEVRIKEVTLTDFEMMVPARCHDSDFKFPLLQFKGFNFEPGKVRLRVANTSASKTLHEQRARMDALAHSRTGSPSASKTTLSEQEEFSGLYEQRARMDALAHPRTGSPSASKTTEFFLYPGLVSTKLQMTDGTTFSINHPRVADELDAPKYTVECQLDNGEWIAFLPSEVKSGSLAAANEAGLSRFTQASTWVFELTNQKIESLDVEIKIRQGEHFVFERLSKSPLQVKNGMVSLPIPKCLRAGEYQLVLSPYQRSLSQQLPQIHVNTRVRRGEQGELAQEVAPKPNILRDKKVIAYNFKNALCKVEHNKRKTTYFYYADGESLFKTKLPKTVRMNLDKDLPSGWSLEEITPEESSYRNDEMLEIANKDAEGNIESKVLNATGGVLCYTNKQKVKVYFKLNGYDEWLARYYLDKENNKQHQTLRKVNENNGQVSKLSECYLDEPGRTLNRTTYFERNERGGALSQSTGDDQGKLWQSKLNERLFLRRDAKGVIHIELLDPQGKPMMATDSQGYDLHLSFRDLLDRLSFSLDSGSTLTQYGYLSHSVHPTKIKSETALGKVKQEKSYALNTTEDVLGVKDLKTGERTAISLNEWHAQIYLLTQEVSGEILQEQTVVRDNHNKPVVVVDRDCIFGQDFNANHQAVHQWSLVRNPNSSKLEWIDSEHFNRIKDNRMIEAHLYFDQASKTYVLRPGHGKAIDYDEITGRIESERYALSGKHGTHELTLVKSTQASPDLKLSTVSYEIVYADDERRTVPLQKVDEATRAEVRKLVGQFGDAHYNADHSLNECQKDGELMKCRYQGRNYHGHDTHYGEQVVSSMSVQTRNGLRQPLSETESHYSTNTHGKKQLSTVDTGYEYQPGLNGPELSKITKRGTGNYGDFGEVSLSYANGVDMSEAEGTLLNGAHRYLKFIGSRENLISCVERNGEQKRFICVDGCHLLTLDNDFKLEFQSAQRDVRLSDIPYEPMIHESTEGETLPEVLAHYGIHADAVEIVASANGLDLNHVCHQGEQLYIPQLLELNQLGLESGHQEMNLARMIGSYAPELSYYHQFNQRKYKKTINRYKAESMFIEFVASVASVCTAGVLSGAQALLRIASQTAISATANAAHQLAARHAHVQSHFDGDAFIRHTLSSALTAALAEGADIYMNSGQASSQAATQRIGFIKHQLVRSTAHALIDQGVQMSVNRESHVDGKAMLKSIGRNLFQQVFAEALPDSEHSTTLKQLGYAGVESMLSASLIHVIDPESDMLLDMVSTVAGNYTALKQQHENNILKQEKSAAKQAKAEASQRSLAHEDTHQSNHPKAHHVFASGECGGAGGGGSSPTESSALSPFIARPDWQKEAEEDLLSTWGYRAKVFNTFIEHSGHGLYKGGSDIFWGSVSMVTSPIESVKGLGAFINYGSHYLYEHTMHYDETFASMNQSWDGFKSLDAVSQAARVGDVFGESLTFVNGGVLAKVGKTAGAFEKASSFLERFGVFGRRNSTLILHELEQMTNSVVTDEVAALKRIEAYVKTYQNLHQTIRLKGAVVDEFLSQSSGLSKNQIKRQVGPVIGGVMDKKTGKIFLGSNHPYGLPPENIHSLLRERVKSSVSVNYEKTHGAGSHAEIYALNEALHARPGAALDDFLLYTINSGQRTSAARWGLPIPRCPQCEHITSGVGYYPGPLRYRR